VFGTARVINGKEVFEISEDQSTYIPSVDVHRPENSGKIALSLIEVHSRHTSARAIFFGLMSSTVGRMNQPLSNKRAPLYGVAV